MKGNISIHLNQSTMIEAVQYWLDNVVFNEAARQNVRSVTGDEQMIGFKIELEDREIEPSP